MACKRKGTQFPDQEPNQRNGKKQSKASGRTEWNPRQQDQQHETPIERKGEISLG